MVIQSRAHNRQEHVMKITQRAHKMTLTDWFLVEFPSIYFVLILLHHHHVLNSYTLGYRLVYLIFDFFGMAVCVCDLFILFVNEPFPVDLLQRVFFTLAAFGFCWLLSNNRLYSINALCFSFSINIFSFVFIQRRVEF